MAERVKLSMTALRDAYEWACTTGMNPDSGAYVSRETGKIHYASDLTDEEPLPDDIENDAKYAVVPDRNGLDLGRRLAIAFVREHLPADLVHALEIFHRRGAYGRFRSLLERRRQLDAWYVYEDAAIDHALRQWCEDNGFVATD